MLPRFRATVAHAHSRFLEAYELLRLYETEPYVCLLEGPGKHTFLSVEPFMTFRSKRKQALIGFPGDAEPSAMRPFDCLRHLLHSLTGETATDVGPMPPFVSGACGYFSYEALHEIEDIPDTGRDEPSVPDIYLMFPQTVFASDAVTRTLWILSTGVGPDMQTAQRNAVANQKRTVTRIAALEEGDARTESAFRESVLRKREALFEKRPRLETHHLEGLGITPVLSRERYIDVVRQAKEHIFAGDVFEVCTTQRFDSSYRGSTLDLYRHLRIVNEAPYSAFLRLPGLEVASSSPERFMQLTPERWAETRPIKGTRPRGATSVEDARLKEDLATCEKDRAENLMIVDVARNDLGRVCELGTVTVPQFLEVETYPYTHQLVSTVRGKLKPEHDAIDLLRAAMPGGSMTGAPKIEAMKIIDRLEPVNRGVFSGNIGYLDFRGGLDLSIVIRTLVRTPDHLTFHVGGAIVADSDPAQEYQETLDKAHGLVAAIEIAERGGETS